MNGMLLSITVYLSVSETVIREVRALEGDPGCFHGTWQTATMIVIVV